MKSKKSKKQILEETEIMKEKLTKLFHDMLDFKHKEYDENLSFDELLKLTSIHYNYESYLFNDAYAAVKYGKVFVLPSEADNPFRDPDEDLTLPPEGILETLTTLYDCLTEKDNDYQKHANDDVDIDLSDGKTLKELANEYTDRFVPIFQEMLDVEKVPYDAKEDNSFSSLFLKVVDAYPWYYDLLFYLYHQIFSSLDSSYVDIINTCAASLKRLENYKKERDAFYKEHADIIEAHKKWLVKKEEVQKYNQEMAKKCAPYDSQLQGLYKDLRKAKRARNRKEISKYMKQIDELKKMLQEKYPFKSIEDDPYDQIKYKDCFDDFEDLENDEYIP